MTEESVKRMYALQGVREYSRELWSKFDEYEDDETWTTEEVKQMLIQEHDRYRQDNRVRPPAKASEDDGTDSE